MIARHTSSATNTSPNDFDCCLWKPYLCYFYLSYEEKSTTQIANEELKNLFAKLGCNTTRGLDL